jgi:hypothetical protein
VTFRLHAGFKRGGQYSAGRFTVRAGSHEQAARLIRDDIIRRGWVPESFWEQPTYEHFDLRRAG